MTTPRFFHSPDELPNQTIANLVRTPPLGSIKGIITAHVPIACPTHFHARRTVPCSLPPNCDLCSAGLKWRLHAYLSFVNLANLAHEIIEFPARQYDAIAAWYKRLSSIRGLYFEASRPNGRPNGPINLIIKRPATIPESLPDPLNVERILCRIWGVPDPPDQPQPNNTQNRSLREQLQALTDTPNEPEQQNNNTRPHPEIESLLTTVAERTKIPGTNGRPK